LNIINDLIYNFTWITASRAPSAPALAAADGDDTDEDADDDHHAPEPAELRRSEADRVK
jgi:hypothetical protein